MPFSIYSAIPARVVSVQTDMQGTYQVVGDQHHQLQVNLNFAKIHVNGDGITQAPTFNGANGRLEVRLLNNNDVSILPVP
jgi:hypothetical protein